MIPASIILTVRTPEERFWIKVNKDGPIPSHAPNLGRCWQWTGWLAGTGRARMWYLRKARPSSHIIWFLTYGKWPMLKILHKCDNPACVNPEHLWEGTMSDNHKDMVSKGRDKLYGGLNKNEKERLALLPLQKTLDDNKTGLSAKDVVNYLTNRCK